MEVYVAVYMDMDVSIYGCICRRNYRTPGNIEQRKENLKGGQKFFYGGVHGDLRAPKNEKNWGVKIFFLRVPPLDFQKMFYISWCSKIPPTYIWMSTQKTFFYVRHSIIFDFCSGNI